MHLLFLIYFQNVLLKVDFVLMSWITNWKMFSVLKSGDIFFKDIWNSQKNVNEAKYVLPSLLAGLFITWQGYRYFTVVNMTA